MPRSDKLWQIHFMILSCCPELEATPQCCTYMYDQHARNSFIALSVSKFPAIVPFSISHVRFASLQLGELERYKRKSRHLATSVSYIAIEQYM